MDCLPALQIQAESHWKGCAGNMTMENDVDKWCEQTNAKVGVGSTSHGEEELPPAPAKWRRVKTGATHWQNFTQEKLKPHHF